QRNAHTTRKPKVISSNKTSKTRLREAAFGLFTGLVVLCGLAVGLNSALAQTLQLRFPFDDPPGSTTTASDTSGGGLSVTLSMQTATSIAVDMHGAAGSGI